MTVVYTPSNLRHVERVTLSLRATVAAMVDERGEVGTIVDDLLPQLEGYDRRQVIRALQNAAWAKLISCDGERFGGKRGRLPGVYRPYRAQDLPARIGPVCSVFALGEHFMAYEA